MPKRPITWDRHAILAAIKRRYGSLKDLADQTDLTASQLSAALSSPYPRAERAIAKALGIRLPTLWPERYFPDGQRRPHRSKAAGACASQNGAAVADGEDAA